MSGSVDPRPGSMHVPALQAEIWDLRFCASKAGQPTAPPHSTNESRARPRAFLIGVWPVCAPWRKPFRASVEVVGGDQFPIGIARAGIAHERPLISDRHHLAGCAIDDLAFAIL